ncbi:G surface protein, allelic form 168-like isoform X7 [Haliotis rufescens]|uniref:G surface protein, allelic form 168-like isoform X7 n=1 Tax=Haliotis rufescens TaxID=6454 RepID=UPI00201F03DD|nr:G surface protein, allelic form 168-like isoform X7 [Haliotis rufescens]
MTGIVVSVLVTVLLVTSGSATPTEDIEGYFKDLRKDVMQRFDGLEKSNEALLKELHQFEDAIGPEAKEKANRNQGAGCEDHSRSCSKYAKRGYCRKKADQMLKKCPKSCNACMNVTTLLPAQETTKSSTDAGCVDHSHRCPKYAKKGLCEKKHHLVKICPKSCNACMDVTTQLPAQEATNSSTGAGCEDHSRSCSKYAKRGYCKEKADQMLKKCPKSCNACMNVTTLLPAQETTKSSTDAGCVDHSHRCPRFAKNGLCEKSDHVVKKCPKSCNACMDVTTQLPAQETTNSSTDAGCVDHIHRCPKYAKKGLCKRNDHVVKKCLKSCNACMDVTTQLPAQETTNSSTDAGCVDHIHRCPKYAKKGLCERNDHVVKKCPKSCNACMNVTTQLPAQETTTSSTGAGCEDRSSICSIYAKRGYCNDKGDKLLKLCPKSCNACINVTTKVPAQETTKSSTVLVSLPLAKDRRHRTKDAFLSIDPPSDSDTEQTRQRLNIRHRTPKASIAIDPVPKRPQPRKNIRHRTPKASIAIDPVPKRQQPRKNIRHRTREASIAIDPVPKHPQPRKNRRHRTNEAFLSVDPPSASDTEHQQPRFTKPHYTRKAADQVPKRPQRRNGNDVAVDSPHLAVDPVPLGVRQHSREGILNDRVHVRQGRPEVDLEQHRLSLFEVALGLGTNIERKKQ